MLIAGDARGEEGSSDDGFRGHSLLGQRAAIIITTNKSIREWTELLPGDEVLATANLDRLLHHAHVLNIKGRSYRLRNLEEARGITT